MKRVGDCGAVGESERGEELSIDFREQDGLRRRGGPVERGELRESLLISRRPETQRQTHTMRNRVVWMRAPVSVGGSAEVVHPGLREGLREGRGDHVVPHRPPLSGAGV